MAVNHRQYATALVALRMAEKPTLPSDRLAWDFIADFVGVSHTTQTIVGVAGLLAEYRGKVGSEFTTKGAVLAFGQRYPGEHADLTGWDRLGRDPVAGQPLAHWDRSRCHCKALIVAYLMGMDVSEDVHAACVEFGLVSRLSEQSHPVESPYPMGDPERFAVAKRIPQ